ncbi:hypothetical protein ACVBEH_16455, partial [Roseateles sp. GG27B]
MKILVLGSGADGGVPQWNCSCPACCAARASAVKQQPQRSQSSVAVSQDGLTWVLLNVSPDINQQIRANPQLQPQRPAVGADNTPLNSTLNSPIKALVL